MTATPKIPAHGLAHRGDAPLRPSRKTVRAIKESRRARLAGQIPLDFGDPGKREDIRAALLEVGQDPNPGGTWKRSRVCQQAVELFPDGMTHAEVGFVLGMHKQSVYKIEQSALQKIRDALGDDIEAFRDLLRAADERRDYWDDVRER